MAGENFEKQDVARDPEEKLKAALTAVIGSIQQDPANAKAVFRASASLESGVQCTVSVRKFDPLVIDEPAALGGTDAGMNPVELILGALGTCQQIVYAAYAAVLGIQLDAVDVECEGQLDLRGLFGLASDVRPGYSEIRFATKITSPESADRIRELVAIVESRCPVLDIITNPVPVRGEVVLNGEPLSEQRWG